MCARACVSSPLQESRAANLWMEIIASFRTGKAIYVFQQTLQCAVSILVIDRVHRSAYSFHVLQMQKRREERREEKRKYHVRSAVCSSWFLLFLINSMFDTLLFIHSANWNAGYWKWNEEPQAKRKREKKTAHKCKHKSNNNASKCNR